MLSSGFVWFVLSLVKKYYLRQFSLFAWTHVALLCVVTQSYLIIQNMFQGLIWLIMPVIVVIINDIMATSSAFSWAEPHASSSAQRRLGKDLLEVVLPLW